MKNFENIINKLKNKKEIWVNHGLKINIENKDYKGLLVEGRLNNEIKLIIEKEGFNLYGLRHNDSDWTEPVELTIGKCLVNSMGVFITKEKFIYGGKEFYIDRSCHIELNKKGE